MYKFIILIQKRRFSLLAEMYTIDVFDRIKTFTRGKSKVTRTEPDLYIVFVYMYNSIRVSVVGLTSDRQKRHFFI